MVMNLCCRFYRFGESRNDKQSLQFQSGRNNLLPETSQVILVPSMNFLDQTMHPQSLEHPGDLGARVVNQNPLFQVSEQDRPRYGHRSA